MLISEGKGRQSGLFAVFKYLPVVLVFCFVIISFLSLLNLSPTTDEPSHYRYGKNILAGIATRFDDSKMPVSALNALPARLADYLPTGEIQAWLQSFAAARLMTVIFSALVAWVVFVWARKLYGFFGGLAALTLYVFDPNIIAHSQLVTTDIYATGTILFAVFTLWQFAQTHRARDGWLCALLLGLSLIAKYTSVVLLPLFLLALIIKDWPDIQRSGRAAIIKWVGRYTGYVLIAALVSLLVINIGFLFERSFTAFGDYHFSSALFNELQQANPALSKLPVPVPYPYLEGLDLVYMREQTGVGFGMIYFLGRLSEGKGFAGYYLVAFLLKEPLATQAMILTALIAYFMNKKFVHFRKKELFLFLPTLFFGLYFNFFYNAQIGIRYYLVIFPLLYIFVGSYFESWPVFKPFQKAAASVLFVLLLVSTFSYYPNFIPYFNEIVWDRKMAYKYLADSNVDWNQGKYDLDQYLADHPEADFAPKGPKPGLVVVGVNDLVGVTARPAKYGWLRRNFIPVDTIVNEFLIYRISDQEYAKLCATSTYCK
jgi:hypothetical protein